MKDWIFYPIIVIAATISGVNVVDAVRPKAVSMAVEYLRYEGGLFHQSHRVVGTDRLRAEWAARITRGETFLCVGGGVSTYSTGPSPLMTPDFWTDDDCPPLGPGDVATATWEYVDEDGGRHRVSAEIKIK